MHFGHLEPRVEGCLQTHNFTKQNSDKSYSTEKAPTESAVFNYPQCIYCLHTSSFPKEVKTKARLVLLGYH